MYLDDDNLSAGLLLQQPLDVLALAYQPQQGTLGNKFNCILKSNDNVSTSVSDPSHFDVDPDPGIHIWEKWIQILGSTFP